MPLPREPSAERRKREDLLVRQSMAAGAHPDQDKRRPERLQRDCTRLGGERVPSKSRDHSVRMDMAARPCRRSHRHCTATRELSMDGRAIRLVDWMTFNDNDTTVDDETPVLRTPRG